MNHYDDVIMTTMASQITSLTVVYSTVYSDADQSNHQSSASLAFMRGFHWGQVNSPHKWPVTRKMFPFDDVIMFQGDGTERYADQFFYTIHHWPTGFRETFVLWVYIFEPAILMTKCQTHKITILFGKTGGRGWLGYSRLCNCGLKTLTGFLRLFHQCVFSVILIKQN